MDPLININPAPAALISTSARYPQLSGAPGVLPFAPSLLPSRIGWLGTIGNRCNRTKTRQLMFPALLRPIVCSPLPFPLHPSLAMVSCPVSGISSTVLHAFRPLLLSGSLPIDRDRVASLGVEMWNFGAFLAYSYVLYRLTIYSDISTFLQAFLAENSTVALSGPPAYDWYSPARPLALCSLPLPTRDGIWSRFQWRRHHSLRVPPIFTPRIASGCPWSIGPSGSRNLGLLYVSCLFTHSIQTADELWSSLQLLNLRSTLEPLLLVYLSPCRTLHHCHHSCQYDIRNLPLHYVQGPPILHTHFILAIVLSARLIES